MMNSAFREGLEEFVRMLLLAVIPVLIVSLESGMFDLKATLLAVLIAALRATDRFVHEEKSIKSKGLIHMVTGQQVEL